VKSCEAGRNWRLGNANRPNRMGRFNNSMAYFLVLDETLVEAVSLLPQPMLLIAATLRTRARANVKTFFISNSLW
jgi:hypothetical protein